MNTFTIIAIAAASFIATAGTAQPVRTDISVSYADLNLASQAGQATLARRISVAAKSACDVNSDQRDMPMKQNSARCYDNAVSGARIAVATANAPMLASR